MAVFEFEYLISYITLTLDAGDEENGLGYWLNAMDESLESGELSEAQRLLQLIRRFPLSAGGLAQVELARANWYENRLINEEAINSYRKAIRTFRRIGNESAEAFASNSLGLLYQKMSLNEQAIIQFRVAAKLYKRLGDYESLGGMLSNIGIVFDAQRDWLKAIPYYERAAKAFIRAESKRQLASAFNNLGVAHEMLGNFESAEDAYQRCIELLDEIGQSKTHSAWRIISNLAQLYAKLGDTDKSIQHHELAFKVALEISSEVLCALTLNNLGALHEEIGEKQKAADYYYEALDYQKEQGDRNIQAMLLNNLGSVLMDLGSVEDAQICFDESLALSREIKDLAGEARTLNNLAVFLEKQEQLDNAVHVYQQAEAILESIGDVRRELTTLINIASVAWKNSDDEVGRAAFHKAWRLAQTDSFHNELAVLFQLRGDWSASYRHSRSLAKRWYQKAMEICTDGKIKAGLEQRLNWLEKENT